MSIWGKLYSRINWKNTPDIETPINESNLNKMDYAIDEMDNRIIELSGYEERAATSASMAATSETNAAKSEENTLKYANSSLESANSAKVSEESALDSAKSAESASLSAQNSAEESAKSAEASAISELNALSSANSAKEYADQITGQIDTVSQSAEVAEEAAQNAEKSAEEAEESAGLAEQQALMAESYTHGGTGLRTNEAVDNAQYYLAQAKQLSQSMNGLIPMGTISFADLSVAENQVDKYMFNISDDFTTDDTFKEGAGHEFPAGTNVYRTNDGYWDCLAGSFQTPNGDTKDNTTSFVQATSRANITSGEKHSTIFGKIAKIFADLKTVAFSGSYSDLSNTPTAATTSAAGLMSASDKSKLDGIASGANAYTHPTTSGNKHIPSGGSSGQILRWSADGTAAWGADNNTVYTHPSYSARTGVPTANQTPAFGGTFKVSQPVSDATGHISGMNSRTITIPSTAATTSAAGLMSASDKSKLDGIASGATKNTIDSAMSSTSTNAVQNKVINAALEAVKDNLILNKIVWDTFTMDGVSIAANSTATIIFGGTQKGDGYSRAMMTISLENASSSGSGSSYCSIYNNNIANGENSSCIVRNWSSSAVKIKAIARILYSYDEGSAAFGTFD